MFDSRPAVFTFLAISLLLSGAADAIAVGAPQSRQSSQPPTVHVGVAAIRSTTSWDERDPGREPFELPLLVLRRGRKATSESQRTLDVALSGVEGGRQVQVQATSLHQDVRTGGPFATSATFVTPDRSCAVEDPCILGWTMDAAEMPSDLYHLRVLDEAGETLWANPGRPDFAALDTWDVALGEHTVRVTYATLFPFAKGAGDRENRLAPDQVTDFIAFRFAPIIEETWRTQVEEWGFGDRLGPDWDSDGSVDVIVTDLPYALFGGTGTYSRLVIEGGVPLAEQRIWWFSSNFSFQGYQTLADGYRVLFAHELFHLLQWNVLLRSGCPDCLWLSWLESQARFAPTVQYPELELSQEHLVIDDSHYTLSAGNFLAKHLDTSYAELEAVPGYKYDTALYWRFLYEQYGSLDIIRSALEEMPRHHGSGPVAGMKRALDAAFARVDGPFGSFEESLVAFARALYALRLETGRCGNGLVGQCGGRLYDPEGMYGEPALEAELRFDGAELVYSDAIPTSYGIDFLEVELERSSWGSPLRVELRGEGPAPRFNVQIWGLKPGYAAPRSVTPLPEVVAGDRDGVYAFTIPEADTSRMERLALIITRLDAEEAAVPEGSYTITLGTAQKGALLPLAAGP